MTEYGKTDLKLARLARKMPRYQLARAVGVSEKTIERWENPNDPSMPTFDDVDRIGETLDVPLMWHWWMMGNCASYRKRFAHLDHYEALASVMRVRYKLNDVLDLQSRAELVMMSGRFDDPALKTQYRTKLREAVSSIQQAHDQLGAA